MAYTVARVDGAVKGTVTAELNNAAQVLKSESVEYCDRDPCHYCGQREATELRKLQMGYWARRPRCMTAV